MGCVISIAAPGIRTATIAVLAGLVVVCPPTLWAAETTASTPTSDLTELPLEKLMEMEVPRVYSASKFEQKTTQAPASVSVISADEIKRYGHRTLAEVLQTLQGFHVSYDRNYTFLGIRGMSLGDFNSRILLLVDGHRVNNNLTDGALIGNAFTLDIDLVERVEVIRGPGSVLYGNNAFLGVINVVTRRGAQVNGLETSGEYGGFDTYKGRVSYGRAFTNGLDLLLSGSFYDSEGPSQLYFEEYDTPAQNFGVARNADDEFYGSFFGSVIYQDFTLQGAFLTREKINPTAQFFTTFNDRRLRTEDERSYARLKYAHDFPEVAEITAQVYYDRNDFEIGYPFSTPVGDTLFKETQTGEWWGGELQASKHLWEKHIISVGAEYRDDFRQEQQVYDAQTGQTFTENDDSRESHSAYAEGDFAARENIHLIGGLRYDHYSDFDAHVNPRVAVIYNPFTESTFKAIYGTAFRAPNFLELSDPRFQDIGPEEIRAYELVYEQGLWKNLRSSVAGFYNRMDDLIAFYNGSFNNFDAESRGVELALEALWAAGLRGRASYTFQNVENRDDTFDLPDAPEHLLKVNLSLPVFKDKVFAGLEFQYTSQRNSVFTTTTGETLPGRDVSGFGVVNFTLFSRELLKRLEASATIYNLLDEDYADPASRFHLQDQIPRDGRSFRLKLTYRF